MSKAAERSNKRTKMLSLSRTEKVSFTTRNKTVCAVSCSIGWLKGVGEVVFLANGKEVCGERLFQIFVSAILISFYRSNT